MVAKANPNSNFQPYEPPGVTPPSEEPRTGLSSLAERFGLSPDTIRNVSDRVRNMNGRDVLERGRDFAKSRPAIALGGLAVAAIAAGLLRGRPSR